jgi:hypothetical protein
MHVMENDDTRSGSMLVASFLKRQCFNNLPKKMKMASWLQMEKEIHVIEGLDPNKIPDGILEIWLDIEYQLRINIQYLPSENKRIF